MRQLFTATTLLLASIATAQTKPAATALKDQRRLEFTIKGISKDTIYLAGYYGNKLLYNDTAVADAKGKVVFAKPRGYKAGVYAVVVPGPRYFEFLVNEPLVQMSSDTADLGGALTVQKSPENQVFLDYIRFLNDQRKQADALGKQRDATEDPIRKAELKAKLAEYDKAIRAYQEDVVAKHPGTLVAAIVKMSVPPEEQKILKANGTLDSSATYYSYRAHYWDNTDLTDERIIRTPVFQNKFDEYIGRTVPQIPDTINKCADDLIRRMDAQHNDELWRFAVHNVTYKYETSDIMGMDAVFVHMAQTYYCPKSGGKSRAFWMTEEKMDKLCERARKQAPLIIGAQAKNIILPDTSEQKWQDLYRLPQEYVLVVFWDPHCGHCKKELPHIYSAYRDTLRPMGIEVYAVAKATDSTLMADWKKFIVENGLDWVNAGLTWHVYTEAKQNAAKYIPKYTTIESLNYADAWDVYSTPKFFLLDGDRRIIGKQLAPHQIADLVNANRRKKGLPAIVIPPPSIPTSNKSPEQVANKSKELDNSDLSFTQQSTSDETERIIVLGLDGKMCDNSDSDKQALADVLAERLMNKYDVVERVQLDAVLREHKFQMSGLIDESTAVQVGAIAGAEGVVVCRATCLDGKNLYTAKLIDCKNGKQVWAGTGSSPTFNKFSTELVKKISRPRKTE